MKITKQEEAPKVNIHAPERIGYDSQPLQPPPGIRFDSKCGRWRDKRGHFLKSGVVENFNQRS